MSTRKVFIRGNEKDNELSLVTTNAYDLNLSVIPVMKPITDYNNQFNELEGNRLSELLDALKIMMSPVVNVNDNEINAFSVDAFNLILPYQENGLQNTVKMAKLLEWMGLEWDSDVIIIDLLSAIILFNSNRPNLINKTAIKVEFHAEQKEIVNCNHHLVLRVMSRIPKVYGPLIEEIK
ncbi:unnamed protein product [Oppiella nova]|uniref:Uncharacterized protein n=1 Tax=Oppiella nova TaxID=334625 RepID=A0A7R9QSY9_9ACAR|nr:unnamed protein product [Oppiella nova]CAG2172811.1 unnamed protein product [Oppiella nova]